jgi:hypothetical protein
LRPFARRRLITAWPPGVLMRARNPWVRWRRTRLGWYVRFIGGSSTGWRVPLDAHPGRREEAGSVPGALCVSSRCPHRRQNPPRPPHEVL